MVNERYFALVYVYNRSRVNEKDLRRVQYEKEKTGRYDRMERSF